MDDTSFEIVTLKNPSNDPFDIVYNNHIYRTIPAGMAMRLPKKPFGILAEKHLIDRMCNINKQPTNDVAIRAHWRGVIVMEEDVDNGAQPIDPNVIMQRQLDRLNGSNESGEVKTCDTCGVKTFNLHEHNALNHAPAAPVAPAPAAPAIQPAAPAIPPAPAVPQYAPPIPTAPVIPAVQAATPVLDGTGGAGLPPIEKPAPVTDAQKEVAGVLTGVAKKADAMVLPEQTVQEVEAPAEYTVDPNPTRETLIAYAASIGMKIDEPKTKAFLDTTPIETLKIELNYGL
jgi:hypothetical protein